jgi:hypothetical protein
LSAEEIAQRVRGVFAQLRALLERIESGSMVASPSMRLRVEGALVALAAVTGVGADDLVAALGDESPDHPVSYSAQP